MSALILPPVLPVLAEIREHQQRTEDWHAMRAGRFTGSKFVSVLARAKKDGAPLKAYWDLVWQIVVERMTGVQAEGPKGFALEWGTEVEPFGIAAVEDAIGHVIESVGFLVHPKHDFIGASPDGLIGDVGGLELKCPKDPAVHLARFTDGMEAEHMPQVQGAMYVTGRQWWIFASFDPRMPLSHQLYMQLVPRDDAFIQNMEASILEAEAHVQERLAKIRAVEQQALVLPGLVKPLAAGARPAPAF